jgi:predicted nucleic acid-binding protein
VANKQRPPIAALDASVIVAGLLSWHEYHQAASAELVPLLKRPEKIVVPLHSLVEAYAVLTRLPPPHRLSPENSLALLEGSFRGCSTIVGLHGEEGWDLIEELGRQSIAGGTSYDGLIVACARKGDAQRILTFNRKHFERLGSEGINIVVPGGTEEV